MITCKCGLLNDISELKCSACEEKIQSPPNIRGESFTVGDMIFFKRLKTFILERGIVSGLTTEQILLEQGGYAFVEVSDIDPTCGKICLIVEYELIECKPELHGLDNVCHRENIDLFTSSKRVANKSSAVVGPGVTVAANKKRKHPAQANVFPSQQQVKVTVADVVEITSDGSQSDVFEDRDEDTIPQHNLILIGLSQSSTPGRSSLSQPSKRGRPSLSQSSSSARPSISQHSSSASKGASKSTSNTHASAAESSSSEQTSLSQSSSSARTSISQHSSSASKDASKSSSDTHASAAESSSTARMSVTSPIATSVIAHDLAHRNSSNRDLCAHCGQVGDLLCCDYCPRSYHSACATRINTAKSNRIQQAVTTSTSTSSTGASDELELWKCPKCQQSLYSEEFTAIDLDSKFPYEYLSQFSIPRKSLRSKYFATIGEFLHYADLVLSYNNLQKLVPCISKLICTEENRISRPRLTLLSEPLWPTDQTKSKTDLGLSPSPTPNQPSDIVRKLCENGALGEPLFLSLYQELLNGGCHLGLGLRLSMVPLVCECGQRRYFRRFCHCCCRLFGTVGTEGFRDSSEFRISGKKRIVTQYNDSDETCLTAAIRGLKMVYSVGLTSKFARFGGDILFLLRNLAVATKGELQVLSKHYFLELLCKWVDLFNSYTNHDLENSSDFEYTIEVLSVLQRMFRTDTLEHKLFESIMGQPDASNPDRTATLQSWRHFVDRNDLYCPLKVQNEAVSSTDSNDATEQMVISILTEYKAELDGITASSTQGSDSSIAPIENGSTRKSNIEYSPEYLLAGLKKLNFCQLRDSIQLHYRSTDVHDVLGYDPERGRVPVTQSRYCGHCGFTWKKGADLVVSESPSPSASPSGVDSVMICPECRLVVRKALDYGSMTDALVKAYVAREAGISSTFCGGEEVSLHSILAILPVVRAYQPVDALGHNFFKLECYFVTHLIYVFSDWGQHQLNRTTFYEEFEFICTNLLWAIRVKDPEIVAEFLQCLAILQYSPKTDPFLIDKIDKAKHYLLTAEGRNSQSGQWPTQNAPHWERRTIDATTYDKYHSSYCVSIGLATSCVGATCLAEAICEPLGTSNPFDDCKSSAGLICDESKKDVVRIRPGLKVKVNWETFRDFTPWYKLPQPSENYYVDAVYKRWVDSDHQRIFVSFPALQKEWEMDLEWAANFGLNLSAPGRVALSVPFLQEHELSSPKKVLAIPRAQLLEEKRERKRILDQYLDEIKSSSSDATSTMSAGEIISSAPLPRPSLYRYIIGQNGSITR